MLNNLIQKNVIIYANDFIDCNLLAKITSVDEQGNKMLLELDSPLICEKITYSKIIIAPRLNTEKITDLVSKNILGCSAIWIPDDKYNISVPFDLNWWRGGAAAITSIKLKN